MTGIATAQAELIDEFGLFDSWLDKYQYLIDHGRKLPDFPAEYKTDEYRLHGCQSQVWLRADEHADRLEFQAISDSAIVSGLIAVLMRVYNGRSPQEILATPPDNGLHAMIDAIKGHAARCAG